MKIVVDFDLCEGNAVCMQIAPDVFEVRDDDFLYVLNENPDESDRERMEDASSAARSRRSRSKTDRAGWPHNRPHRRRVARASASAERFGVASSTVASC